MRTLPAILLLLLLHLSASAQLQQIHSELEGQGIYTSHNTVPFWMRSNQFGSVPLDGASFSLSGRFYKDYDSVEDDIMFGDKKVIDWGVGFDGRANFGKSVNFSLIQAYAKARFSIFEFKGGRFKQIMGLCDSTMSSGSFAESGNSIPIPKVQLAIPEFFTIPILGGILAFKGTFAHGWLGSLPIVKSRDDTANLRSYFHQASFYGRFGKPDWKFKLIAGINHEVFFGNERSLHSTALSWLKQYEYVVLGKVYNNSKVGDHIGSIDVGAELTLDAVKILFYRQSFYDKGGLYHLANIKDGLNGISIQNLAKSDDAVFHLSKVVLEFLYTKDQGSSLHPVRTNSGDENYYNAFYYQGYSYHEMAVGTPFITPAKYIKNPVYSAAQDYFINNRVAAYYLGVTGSVAEWDFAARISYSQNFGTWRTSGLGVYFGGDPNHRVAQPYATFKQANQSDFYFEAATKIRDDIRISAIASFDVGDLYYNSAGISIKVCKYFF